MIRDLRSLLISHTCYGCEQALTSQEQYICLKCMSQLQPTEFHHTPKENELYYRLGGRVSIQGATSLFYFDKNGTLQRLLKQLKYQDCPQIGKYLGMLLGKALIPSGFLDDIEALIPVPLHWHKQLKRGYNQSLVICKGLREITQLPLNASCISRRKKTLTQTRLSPEQRWENVSYSFTLTQPPPNSIVLVDDVITTGATLEAIIRTFQSHEQPPEIIKVASIGMARNS